MTKMSRLPERDEEKAIFVPSGGLGLIEEALEIADQGSGLTLLPELYSLKGDLLLLREANTFDAEPWFRRAFDAAGKLDAKMMQLRAAIGLCRSERERGHAQHGLDLLSAVYATFTEGFTAPDLIDAANLLESPSPAPYLTLGRSRERD
jgi:hypothetical protein